MTLLQAGSITARWQDARLTALTVNGDPALDAVYVAVRDAQWGTVPGQIVAQEESIAPAPDAGPDEGVHSSTVRVRHQQADIDVEWVGELTVQPGRIELQVRVTAHSEFVANRIGLCLLHPQTLRGRDCAVRDIAGNTWRTAFPTSISPQPPFTDVAGMNYEINDAGDRLDIALQGEIFETEDHRNWTDPGWKTYGTPLSWLAPTHYRPGDTVVHTVVLTAAASPITVAPVSREYTLFLRPASGAARMPQLGALASLEPDAVAQVSAAWPDGHPWSYLAVEIPYRSGDSVEELRTRLTTAVAEAAGLQVLLDVTLACAVSDLEAVMPHVRELVGSRLGRVGVFDPDTHVSTPALLARAAELLPEHTPLVGGSRAHFAELNRHDDCTDGGDWVAYGITPQVHHQDADAILATVPAVGDTLRQSRQRAAGRALLVGPVTWTPRFNATDRSPSLAEAAALDGRAADPRQHSDLAGLYLAGVLGAINGADAVTALHTSGATGVIGADGRKDAAGRVLLVIGSLLRHGRLDVPDTDGMLTVLAGLARPEAGSAGGSAAFSGTGDTGAAPTVAVVSNVAGTPAIVRFPGYRIGKFSTLVSLDTAADATAGGFGGAIQAVDPDLEPDAVVVRARSALRLTLLAEESA